MIESNVVIEQSLNDKILGNALTVIDYYDIALANALAQLFPQAAVYLSPQEQGAVLPAVFISNYSVTAQDALGGVTVLEADTEITYLNADETAYDERQTALAAILAELPRVLRTDIGAFVLKGFSATNTKEQGMAQVLCRTEAALKLPNDIPIMQNLEQGVDLNG